MESKKETLLDPALLYVAGRFEGPAAHPLFASVMYCNRRSLVFYHVVILLVLILLLSVMMNGCGFSHWSYHVFHLPYALRWAFI